ncbi:MAG: guanylate kinase [Thiolinea sp.]
MKPGQLYIVSAPSGAGKTSLLNELCKQLKHLTISVSHTTRAPRPGEVDGEHYHFFSLETFKEEIEQNLFLEYAQVFDNYYGTSKTAVDTLLTARKDVILEIDWQGARQVRERADSVISIFILPPSQTSLEERLRNRQQDSEEIIQRRMRDARNEIAHYSEYDYVIINDNFEDALADLVAIFRSERLRLKRQLQHHAELLAELVK